jgi:hypothetical protein
MKTYGGVDIKFHAFLTSVLVGGEWSASRPGRLTPAERAPDTHWIGGWVGPRTDQDDMEKRKPCLHGDSNTDPSAVQPVASCYSDCGIPVPLYTYTVAQSQLT